MPGLKLVWYKLAHTHVHAHSNHSASPHKPQLGYRPTIPEIIYFCCGDWCPTCIHVFYRGVCWYPILVTYLVTRPIRLRISYFIFQGIDWNCVNWNSSFLVQLVSIQTFCVGFINGQTTITRCLPLCFSLWCFCTFNSVLDATTYSSSFIVHFKTPDGSELSAHIDGSYYMFSFSKHIINGIERSYGYH